MYDNSKAFSVFLRQQKLDDVLRKTKLKLKKMHTIVPHVRFYDFRMRIRFADSV